MLQRFIQWYIHRFPFPHRGLKYLVRLATRQQLMDVDFVKPMKNGVQLHCRLAEHIERQILWYGGYELRETKWLLQELATAKCFYDIGANIGYYAIQAAKLNPQLSVKAFEPSPVNLQRLQDNVQLNEPLPNLAIVPLAIGNKKHQLTLHQSGADNRGMATLASTSTAETFEVEVTRLDAWLTETSAPIPDIIKMDIEGAEWLALQGMEQLIDTHHPTLLLELDDRHLQLLDGNAQHITDWLQQKGYEGFQIAAWEELIPLDLSSQPVDMAIFKFVGQ